MLKTRRLRYYGYNVFLNIKNDTITMQNQWQNFLAQFPPPSIIPATANNIMDLSHLGLLKVTGVDAKKFLQGQLTCNLEEITSLQTQIGAHCTPQGRVISLFRLFYHQEGYYLQMPRIMLPFALVALKKYIVFFKAELSDASDQFICIGYWGDQLKNYLGILPENIGEIATTNNLLILKLKERYQILGQFSALTLLWRKLINAHKHVAADIWEYLDFTAAIPRIYPATTEKFLPHEINLQHLNALSFNKGCYTGQEIIARMQYRGKLKNQLYHAIVNTTLTPSPGGDIYDKTGVTGTIVDYYKKSAAAYELLIISNKTDCLFLDINKQYPIDLYDKVE
jgi:folate-binding protein YgfZ